jgi:hypothetical protein
MAFQVKVLTEQAQALLSLTNTLERDNRLLKQRAAAGRYALRFTQLLSSSIATHRADTATVESILRTQHSKAAVLHQLEEQIHLLTQLAPGITHLPPEEALPEDVRLGSNATSSSSSGSSSTAGVQGGDSSTQLSGLQEGHAPVLTFQMDPVQFFKTALQHYDWATTSYDIDLEAARDMHATLRSGLSNHLQELGDADTPEAAAAASARLLDIVARFWATVGQGAVLAPQVVYRVCMLNLDTGLPDTPTRQHLAHVTDTMCLTLEQKQQVADLLVAFQALQRPHLQQRQQLQQVIAACGSSMSSVVDPSAPGAAPAPPQQQQQQQQQEAGGITRSSSGSVQISPEYTLQLTKQLDSIMRKLAWLEYCLTTLLLCTVGLHQFACFAVAMHPHPLRFVVWAGHVTESLKEAPAALQQQQQQQPQPQQQQQQQHTTAPVLPLRLSTNGNAAKKQPPLGQQLQAAPHGPQQSWWQQQQQQQQPEPPTVPAGVAQQGMAQCVLQEQQPWASCLRSALQLLNTPVPGLPSSMACEAGSQPMVQPRAPAGSRQEPPVNAPIIGHASLCAAPGGAAAESSWLLPGAAAGKATGLQQQQEEEEEGAACEQASGLLSFYPGLGPASIPTSAAAAALVQDGELEPGLAGLLCDLRGVLTSEGTASQQLSFDLALGLA